MSLDKILGKNKESRSGPARLRQNQQGNPVEQMTEQEEQNQFFKFWYENFLIRFSFVIAFTAFLGIFAYAFYTEVTYEPPGETAPFLNTMMREQESTNQSLAEAQSRPLNEAHLSDREIKTWLNTVIAEALTFDSNSYTANKNNISLYMTKSGMQAYEGYLQSAGVLKSLRDSQYRMSVFLEGQPLLINSVVIEDVYRWLYQMPVTLSFIPLSTTDLNRNAGEIVNRKLTLRVQMRRVRLPDNPDAIQIESWDFSVRR